MAVNFSKVDKNKELVLAPPFSKVEKNKEEVSVRISENVKKMRCKKGSNESKKEIKCQSR